MINIKMWLYHLVTTILLSAFLSTGSPSPQSGKVDEDDEYQRKTLAFTYDYDKQTPIEDSLNHDEDDTVDRFESNILQTTNNTIAEMPRKDVVQNPTVKVSKKVKKRKKSLMKGNRNLKRSRQKKSQSALFKTLQNAQSKVRGENTRGQDELSALLLSHPKNIKKMDIEDELVMRAFLSSLARTADKTDIEDELVMRAFLSSLTRTADKMDIDDELVMRAFLSSLTRSADKMDIEDELVTRAFLSSLVGTADKMGIEDELVTRAFLSSLARSRGANRSYSGSKRKSRKKSKKWKSYRGKGKKSRSHGRSSRSHSYDDYVFSNYDEDDDYYDRESKDFNTVTDDEFVDVLFNLLASRRDDDIDTVSNDNSEEQSFEDFLSNYYKIKEGKLDVENAPSSHPSYKHDQQSPENELSVDDYYSNTIIPSFDDFFATKDEALIEPVPIDDNYYPGLNNENDILVDDYYYYIPPNGDNYRDPNSIFSKFTSSPAPAANPMTKYAKRNDDDKYIDDDSMLNNPRVALASPSPSPRQLSDQRKQRKN